jgi:hypothetical protein
MCCKLHECLCDENVSLEEKQKMLRIASLVLVPVFALGILYYAFQFALLLGLIKP